MTTAAYTWQTPEHSYDFIPTTDNLVIVKSESRQAIEDFLSTLELAGPEEGTTLPSTIEEADNSYDHYYFVEVTRPTISLFLDFDVRYYMGATVGN